ncbi:sigma-70 family RNA polymerase sigma factor [Candidatus Woesearchaeota archaeon]|jgi:RNA polymerase sigma-70 factor, ECF subfamily|nr:sigma-70 family RNA polymerase sigma factor [Candidatus Woesearchaeota archaeon]MBT4368113.1 sigma-70 family RNA polymerase sigma factor [Candidatus Woesearchaeota archaeon]MBT4712601.1 sigma-70 family RNA polymerase sigma factor [Candidatus Woesearchaeota archaeon]MBT6639514.1 sigma-70 family RNA polymerase sigma factor [Candidatus Woesearchaeota archaeon]MBT7133686.1 sigma-70 family RNA polymerase sigma factor [Candidatus Woesearchaeota archaeon]
MTTTDADAQVRFPGMGIASEERLARTAELFGEVFLNYCAGLVGDEQASDLYQDVFQTAVEQTDSLGPDQDALIWLRNMARNRARGYHKSREMQLKRFGEADEADLSDEGLSPRDMAQRSDLHNAVRAQVDALQPTYQEAIRLTLLEGHSQRRAAELAGCSPSTIQYRVGKAKEALRTSLGQILD